MTFIVEKDGTLSEIVVEQGLNLALIREVGRVLTLSPEWEPGRLGNGEPVQVRYTLAVEFSGWTEPGLPGSRCDRPSRDGKSGSALMTILVFNPYYFAERKLFSTFAHP